MNLKYLLVVLFVGLVSCNTATKLSKEAQIEYIAKGKEITQKSFKLLSGNLMKQMKQGGPVQAIPFCNVKAIPLTDEIAKQEYVSIKRVSKRFRNEINKPSSIELGVIEDYKVALENGEMLSPVLLSQPTGKPQFYAPILINSKCLVCHGTVGVEVSKATDSLIKSLYPKDLATGYKVGDLRGIWSVQF
ncbi:MAG: hypothetical protein COB60_08780 [Flavobacteriaceae bacterium]|nr:MAG: hypothetical protein COB60_08780 [Flavobacteriaceae bacterium]